jgi:hypothetical protein
MKTNFNKTSPERSGLCCLQEITNKLQSKPESDHHHTVSGDFVSSVYGRIIRGGTDKGGGFELCGIDKDHQGTDDINEQARRVYNFGDHLAYAFLVLKSRSAILKAILP